VDHEVSTTAEFFRRWATWEWICLACANVRNIDLMRLVHQGPYVDPCRTCGAETRYILDPGETA
jgi:hypothetical protein